MSKKNSNFTIDFDDFDDIQGPSSNNHQKTEQIKQNSDQKKKYAHTKSQLMFQAKTISKGFFAQPNQSYSQLMSQNFSPTKLNTQKQVNQNQESPIKSRRKKKIEALEPLNKETKKVQVFRNTQQINDQHYKRVQKKQKDQYQKDQQKLSSIQKQKQKVSVKKIVYQTPKQNNQPHKEQKKSQQIQKCISPTPKENVNKQKQLIQHKVNDQSPETKKNNIFQKEDQKGQEDEDDQDSPNKLIESQQDLQKHIIKIMSSPLKSKTVMKTTIQRNASGFNTFWPIFHLHFLQDKSYLMSAKKTSSKPTSTFIMAASRQNFQENTESYLGKVKSNFMGDTLTIFGPGLNPNDAFQKKKRPRQVLATVVYQSSYFQGGKPRDFRVYLKKTNVDYYTSFPQVKLYEDQIPLNLLYQNQLNRDKIIVLKNRPPQYKEQIKGYMLNFKGRVTKPSIKNFILEDIQYPGVDVMIFGKIGDDTFSMDVYHPLSPCIGFGIAMSSFDSRFLIE